MADKKKILIADDFQLLREDLTELINNQRDMEVVGTASSGKEIVNLARNTEYDLILMDIMMPEMNGYETTKAIRNLPDRPDGKEIPIIAMTANAFAEDVQAALNAGMDDHVAKPVDMSILISAISRFRGRCF